MGNGYQKARRLALALCVWAFAAPVVADEVCRDNRVSLRGDWGQAAFTVEVVDDAKERAQGLMHRESMAKTAGMLFVYPAPKRVGFWMKNTLIELDMIFADRTGTVRRVYHRAQPHDERPVMGGRDIQYVLEINGGMAAQLGISEGSHLQHPAIDTKAAAWPC